MKISNLLAAAAVAAAAMTAAPAAEAQAPGKTLITHEILWMMKRVGNPVVSPDGRWVVYSVTEPSYEPDKAVSDLWLVPAAGGAAARRLDSTQRRAWKAAWLGLVSGQPDDRLHHQAGGRRG